MPSLQAEQSKQHVALQIHLARKSVNVHVVQYFISDQAKSINGLCITPSDFKSRLGEFSEYCPVNLALHDELIDCSTTNSLQYAAEYRYYNNYNALSYI